LSSGGRGGRGSEADGESADGESGDGESGDGEMGGGEMGDDESACVGRCDGADLASAADPPDRRPDSNMPTMVAATITTMASSNQPI
jgi:hypothetical protein